MSKIKTKEVLSDTKKAVDQTALAGQRMKDAYIKTKQSAEHSVYASESTSEEYASDRISDASSNIAREMVHQADVQGHRVIRHSAQKIKERRETQQYQQPQATSASADSQEPSTGRQDIRIRSDPIRQTQEPKTVCSDTIKTRQEIPQLYSAQIKVKQDAPKVRSDTDSKIQGDSVFSSTSLAEINDYVNQEATSPDFHHTASTAKRKKHHTKPLSVPDNADGIPLADLPHSSEIPAPRSGSPPSIKTVGNSPGTIKTAPCQDRSVKTVSTGNRTIKEAVKGTGDTGRAAQKTIKTAQTSVKTVEQSGYAAIKTVEAAKVYSQKSAIAAAKAYQKSRAALKAAVGAAKAAATATAKAVRAVIAATQKLITALAAGGGMILVLVIILVVMCFAGMMLGSDENDTEIFPVNDEVKAYEPLIQKYATEHGIGDYVLLIEAVMMLESGGRGNDPMQCSECNFNTLYPNTPGGITDPEYSINVGIQNLADCLQIAECESPLDIEAIKLALQGYNYGQGYITWAMNKYGGYSKANAIEFSMKTAEQLGWEKYGNMNYVPLVLQYYPLGQIFYDPDTSALIVEVARSQIGNVGGEIYWSWYGFTERVGWCACFVSWCADQCGYIDAGTFPRFSGPEWGVYWFKQQGQWADRNTVPTPGMIIFYDWDDEETGGQDGVTDHVGIVSHVDGNTIYTIEGNSVGDQCLERTRVVGQYEIMGYGVPAY